MCQRQGREALGRDEPERRIHDVDDTAPELPTGELVDGVWPGEEEEEVSSVLLLLLLLLVCDVVVGCSVSVQCAWWWCHADGLRLYTGDLVGRSAVAIAVVTTRSTTTIQQPPPVYSRVTCEFRHRHLPGTRTMGRR